MDKEGRIDKKDELDLAEQALSDCHAQVKCLNDWLEKPVKITLLHDKKTILGTLKDFDSETLILQRPTGDKTSTMLFFKIAVASVELDLSDHTIKDFCDV